jgi:predicted nucleic acid-binding protein
VGDFVGRDPNSGSSANSVTDAHIAALALEHGCIVASTDADFARFPILKWINPINRLIPKQ